MDSAASRRPSSSRTGHGGRGRRRRSQNRPGSLTVTAVYQLSEAGRKASLLAGGDGRAVQQLTRAGAGQPPAPGHRRSPRASPGSSSAHGSRWTPTSASSGSTTPRPTTSPPTRRGACSGRPRATTNSSASTIAERTVTRAKKREADHERRAQVAQAFLADPSQRAMSTRHRRRSAATSSTEPGPRCSSTSRPTKASARDVPPEAHRRFRADLAAKHEQNLQERAAQLALHEEKKRFVAEWIAQHGTPDQQARQAAGVLPMEEAIEAITDQAFAAVADHPPYRADGAERLQAHLRAVPGVCRRRRLPRRSGCRQLECHQGDGRAMGGGSVRAEGAAGRDGDVACAPAHMEEAAAGAVADAVRGLGHPEGRAVCGETRVCGCERPGIRRRLATDSPP